MGLESIELKIDRLINYWKKQSIDIVPSKANNSKYVNLPLDFLIFYKKVNGMCKLYPNESDEEGFLFYPLEAIISEAEEMGKTKTIQIESKKLIFADYMQKSWWYGIEITDNGYLIGIISEESKFKILAYSLSDFIDLYMENSPVLYDYT